ncbi:putative fatty acyl-CoA reductase CG8306 [Cloeon dipterum]|uniref:putative fatty acyl-CoA reductase CG8306 n=1 Tax=Cloeon dipterum TaxID=197152 RepID=UPI0032206820
MPESAIQDFYKGCGIFVTGATGFLGIGLVEKLLRCCPDSGKIYLLVRPKRGKAIEERLEDVGKNRVFEKLKETNPDALSKLVAVAGDIGEENLGLSDADRKTLQDNVSVVFHSAATLDFETGIKPAVQINLRGTRSVVQLAQSLPKLKAFVHVSSAYVNCLRNDVKEELYPVEHDPDKIIEQVLGVSDETALEQLSKELCGDHPNTYTYTKLLAEHVVARAATQISAAIVRPSMITCALKEPVPGWISSTNGPSGFLMGAAKGVVRRLPIATDVIYDYIPVDMVINELIVAAWQAGTQKSSQVSIYHCTTSTQNPFRWNMVYKNMNTMLRKYPLVGAVWYPSIKILTTLSLFKFSSIFVHFIPGFFLDLVARLTGGRPRLVTLHSKINSSLDRLQFFIYNEWKFQNERTRELSGKLSAEDKQRFDFNIGDVDWYPYFDSMTLGVRRYLNKEEPKTLPAALKKQKILAGVHYALLLAIYGLTFYTGLRLSNGDKTLALLSIPLTYLFFSII